MALASTATFALSLLLFLPILSSAILEKEEEEFSEELLLKPLPDRKVLAHFHFQTEASMSEDSFARHHHLFPKSISQLCWMDRLRNFTLKQWSYPSLKVDGTMKDGVDLIQYPAKMQSLLELNCGQSLMSHNIRLMLLGKI
uniref:Uncharacterized protein LOC101506687 n=1 Tax=Cicer arietinum TaxID=3827 RepID=A0A3Q7YGK4_CICAR|nr:uncharacterized protein LOC101506687 [Cicer arietinum]